MNTMYDTLDAVASLVATDGTVAALGAAVYLNYGSVESAAVARVSRFPVKIHSLGFSQTASAGELDPVFYFGITVKMRKPERNPADFIMVGERIVALLHRGRFAGKSVIFSKMMTIDSSFVLQNSNRRINVKVENNEIVHVLFFWASEKTLRELEETETPVENAIFVP